MTLTEPLGGLQMLDDGRFLVGSVAHRNADASRSETTYYQTLVIDEAPYPGDTYSLTLHDYRGPHQLDISGIDDSGDNRENLVDAIIQELADLGGFTAQKLADGNGKPWIVEISSRQSFDLTYTATTQLTVTSRDETTSATIDRDETLAGIELAPLSNKDIKPGVEDLELVHEDGQWNIYLKADHGLKGAFVGTVSPSATMTLCPGQGPSADSLG